MVAGGYKYFFTNIVYSIAKYKIEIESERVHTLQIRNNKKLSKAAFESCILFQVF